MFHQFKHALDKDSAMMCLLTMYLSQIANAQNWLAYIVPGLTVVAGLSTITYNILKILVEIFGWRKKPEDLKKP